MLLNWKLWLMWSSVVGAFMRRGGTHEQPTVTNVDGPTLREDDAQQQNAQIAATLSHSIRDGEQLCNGEAPPVKKTGDIAFVLTGHAFRAKNFFKGANGKFQCTEGTDQSQSMVTHNQVEMVIMPLERLGFKIHVFMKSVDCDELQEHHTVSDANAPSKTLTSTNATSLLADLYGGYGRRVVSIIESTKLRNQQEHVKDMLLFLNSDIKQRGSSYEYVIVLRHDVSLDTPVTSMVPRLSTVATMDGARNYLTFFGSGEDYLMTYPGGLSNCVVQLFSDCLCPAISEISGELTGQHPDDASCYKWGPVDIPKFDAAGVYVDALNRVKQGLDKYKILLVLLCKVAKRLEGSNS
jgi:hypothetical protein